MELLNQINSIVWGPPLLILLMGTGLYLTIRLGLIQVLRLPKALKLIFTAPDKEKEIFQALVPFVQHWLPL